MSRMSELDMDKQDREEREETEILEQDCAAHNTTWDPIVEQPPCHT